MAGKKAKKREKRYSDAKTQAMTHKGGWTPTAVKPPDGFTFFQPKEAKTYRLNILPYEVKKGKDEKGGNPNSDEGFLHYERTYWAHRGVGQDQNTYCCLQRTFGKKCPICRDLAKMRRSAKADPELIKEMEPRERQVFQLIDLAQPDKGIQLWDISYHLFGKKLDAKIKASEDDDGYENFHHLEDGMTLRVTLVDKSFGGKTFLETESIEMKPRKEALPDDLLEEVADLDECLVELEYDELEKIYLGDEDEDEESGSDDDDDDDDDAPAAAKKKPAKKAPAKKPAKPADDDEDDDDDDDDDDDEESDSDDDPDEDDDDEDTDDSDDDDDSDDEDDDEDDDDDSDEDDSDDEDEDDDDEDEDDEPVKKKPAKKAPAKKPGPKPKKK